MICLRCGYCCINYPVVIVKDATKRLNSNNLELKTTGKCKYLQGDIPGKFSCAVHHKSWYKSTPCYKHTQIEQSNTNCRIGEYILKNKNNWRLLHI